MKKTRAVSDQTRNNWLIDTAVFAGVLIASISGIYFLFFPVGGYQGGRNAFYNVQILFQRETWDDLHTWFGILMITAAAVHILVHWKWIVSMTRRTFQALTRKDKRMNSRSLMNVGINMLIGASFLVAAISGIVLLFAPGGHSAGISTAFILSRATWDVVHTWSGILMIVAAVLHFTIHWGWVFKVTRKILRSLNPIPRQMGQVKQVENSQI